MSDEITARKGKIARLPSAVREEVNLRLLNGETAARIIDWLHTLPEVLAVLDEHFGEEPISPANISSWRKGGYQQWLKRRERIENMKTLSAYSLKLAKAAGGSISDGAAAIAGGRILELLEDSPEEDIASLSLAVAKLRDSDAKMITAKINRRKLAQKDRELALAEARFRRQTAEQFLKWASTPEAQAILNSGDSRTVKMDRMIQLMFGERPEKQEESDDTATTSMGADIE